MSNQEQILEGGCSCGAVRYRLLMSPLIVHACHCKNCQRQTGAWHAVNALIEAHEVELVRGKLIQAELPTPSGAGQTVSRCSDCGITLWSNYHMLSRGHGDIVRFIRVGTLDEPHRLPPDVHIFDGDRNTSAPIPAGAPRFETFYDLQEIWQPDSLQRLFALFDPEIPSKQAIA